MTTTTNDPITAIKDEEKKGEKTIAQFIDKKQKELEDLEITREKELSAIKETLSEEGRKELEEAKKQGMEKYKEISDSEKGKRETFIHASDNQSENASKAIVEIFTSYISK